MATNVALSGEAETQIKTIRERLGGSIPQHVRIAIKQYFDRLFPQHTTDSKPPN